jgi:hypothetical protein
MSNKSHISIFKMGDSAGERLLVCCSPKSGQSLVCIHDEETGADQHAAGIIIDTTGPLQITNPKEISALAAWLSAAAIWLDVEMTRE